MEGRKWEELEMECLVNILGRVGLESLLLNVPLVCKSWCKATHNPQCWTRIVFPSMLYQINTQQVTFADRLVKSFMTAFLKLVINRSCCNKAGMIALPGFCTNEALIVAHECPALRTLFLRYGSSYDKFCVIFMPKLFQIWKNLEDLMLVGTDKLNEIVTQISLHCKNFKTLRVKLCEIKGKETSAIVTNLPNPKQLILRPLCTSTIVESEDLKTILQGCK
ncbi:LOW QUALITY PROTEIN: F-box-like domain-containing protein, partial [Cephalotus follicularis]